MIQRDNEKYKNDKVILVDFDGTWINENSPRIFEKITLSYNRGWKWYIIYFIFFSGMSKILNKIYFFISKDVDIRLYLFVHLNEKTIIENYPKIIEEVTRNLVMNRSLYKLYKEENMIILSRGIVDIIDRFSHDNNIKFRKIIGSTLSIKDKKINFKILSFGDKVNYLTNFNNFIYYTDSIKEVNYICDRMKVHMKQMDKKLFVIKR